MKYLYTVLILLSSLLAGFSQEQKSIEPKKKDIPQLPCITAKLTVSKKIVVTNTNDSAKIRIHILDSNNLPCPELSLKLTVTGDIENRHLNYKRTIRTDTNGIAETAIKSSRPGFIQISCRNKKIRFINKAYILFVPNIYFRKGKSSKRIQSSIKRDTNDKIISSVYKKATPKLFWISRYPYGWGTDIEKHVGKFKGIIIHHTAGQAKQTIEEEEKRLKSKFNRYKKRNNGREKKSFLDDLSYNIYITRTGQVKIGRTLYYRGGHAGRDAGLPKVSDLNQETIGICFFGNYHNSRYVYRKKYYVWRKKRKHRRYRWIKMPIVKMTNNQKRVLKSLITMIGYLYNMDLSKKYPNDEIEFKSIRTGGPAYWLDGHGTFKDKNCPGHYITTWMEKERSAIIKNINLLRNNK